MSACRRLASSRSWEAAIPTAVLPTPTGPVRTNTGTRTDGTDITVPLIRARGLWRARRSQRPQLHGPGRLLLPGQGVGEGEPIEAGWCPHRRPLEAGRKVRQER